MSLSIALVLAFVAAAFAQTEYGVCNLRGNSVNPTITGTVWFVNNGSTVTVTALISGITANPDDLHGMHVHQFGDLTADSFSSAGTHYAGPGTGQHGCPPTGSRDEGDMGNWQVTSESVSQQKSLDLLSLSSTYSIIGRAVVLHSLVDDCAATNSSGSRLASCVIGIGNPAYFPSSVGNVSATNAAVNPNAAASSTAICVLQSTSAVSTTIGGTIFFTQDPATNVVNIQAAVTGISGVHGLHAHMFGDLSSGNGDSVSGHYNPNNGEHNLPPASTRHAGDFGNIGCQNDGAGNSYYYYNNTMVGVQGVNNLIGRAMVIHQNADNSSSTSYGSRIAWCVIGLPSTVFTVPDNYISNANVDCGYSANIPTTTGPSTGDSPAVEASLAIVLAALLLLAWL